MKKNEVPQDKSNLSTNSVKELCYAVDEQGNYTTELSSGWEPKSIALSNAMDDIRERVESAKLQCANGTVSPIVYFMELNRMDIGILSSYVGMWRWRVKRHFKPGVFNKLSAAVLLKYAHAFEISIDELKNFKPD